MANGFLSTRLKWPSRIAKPALVCFMAGAVSLSTTGCFDRQELEQQAFITSMGVDAAPGGLVDCTMLIALPKASAGSSGGGGGGGSQPLASKGPITVRGKTIMDAVTLANVSVERSLTMTHLNSVVFGESLAKQGLEESVRPLTRYREFRRTIYVKVAKGTAKDVMTSEQPMLETTNTRLPDDVQNVARRTGLAPALSRLHDLTIALETPHQNAVLPVYAVNEQVKDDPKGEKPIQGKPTYQAGEVKRSGGNPVEYIGGAVFDGDKLVGYLDGQQMMDIRMLQGTLARAKMVFQDPIHKDQTVNLSLREERAPTYRVVLSNPMVINAIVPLDADLTGVGSGVNYSSRAYRMKLESSVDKELQSRLEQLLTKWALQGIDLVPISNSIRGKFLTDAGFTQFPWESRLKHATIHVTVNLHIRRFGTQWSSIQVKV